MTRLSLWILLGATLVFAGGPQLTAGQAGLDQGSTERPFVVVAKKYSFTPARIEVYEGDIVRIELKTDDIAHSFTIDAYRISKRVSPKKPVVFSFRADHVGTFPIYCNLQIDDGCRKMKGELVVKPRP